MFSWIRANNADRHDEEAAPLLDDDPSQENEHSSTDPPPSPYGSTDTITADLPGNAPLNSTGKSTSEQGSDKREDVKPKEAKRHWWTYVRQFDIFVPFVWPSNNARLQLHLVGVVLCLAVIRLLNVLAPRQLGIVINGFGKSPAHVPVADLLLYLFFDWLTAASIIGSLKECLWLPVELNAHKTIVTATFNHIMGLSCNFHDNKRSGELYMAMSQGRSVYSLFNYAFFDVLPMLVDLGVACVYLSHLFSSYMPLLLATTTILYFGALKYLAAMQVDVLRQSTEAVRTEYQVMFDALGNWLAVAYFGNFKHEQKRYKAAVEGHLKTLFKSSILHYLSWTIEASILQVGLAAAIFLAAYQIATGKITVGDFVLLLSYWARFTSKIWTVSSVPQLADHTAG